MFVGQLIVLKHFDQQVETFTKVIFEIFVISVGKCSFGKKEGFIKKRNKCKRSSFIFRYHECSPELHENTVRVFLQYFPRP